MTGQSTKAADLILLEPEERIVVFKRLLLAVDVIDHPRIQKRLRVSHIRVGLLAKGLMLREPNDTQT